MAKSLCCLGKKTRLLWELQEREHTIYEQNAELVNVKLFAQIANIEFPTLRVIHHVKIFGPVDWKIRRYAVLLKIQ